MKKFGKTYTDIDEHTYRLSVFKSNLRRAKRNQKLDPSAIHGITQFSDLTPKEFRRNLLGVEVKQDNPPHKTPIGNDLPADFDWRDRNVVTSVKNQLYCGSSYAFSALGAIEGAYALANGKHVDLSEQDVIDCSYRKFGSLNAGCYGGLLLPTFNYLQQKGFVFESERQYSSGNTQVHGTCRHPSRIRSVGVAKYHPVHPNNENLIAANLVKYGPLAVLIKMNTKFGHTYIGGVSCPRVCPDELINLHHVVLVGYGAGTYSLKRLKQEPYWIYKNSWGTSFGEKGFFEVCRGNDDACGGMHRAFAVT